MKDYKIIATVGEDELKKFNELNLSYLDILEVRLDLCENDFVKNQLSDILKKENVPVLFTYRLPKDSSLSSKGILLSENISELLKNFDHSNNYIDIELDNIDSIFKEFINSKFTKILSYHNFNNMISEKELVDFIELSQEKTKIVNVIYKFAVMVENLDSAKNFMQLISKYSNEYSLIGIIMGEIGLYSRVFGDLFGSKMTYCTLTEPKAPGQIQPKTLVNLRNKKLEEFSKNPLEYHDIKNLIV